MTNYITDEIQNNAIKALGRMIAQPSYNTEAAPNAPFGTGIRLALDEVLKIADELGYQTYVDPEGYYG